MYPPFRKSLYPHNVSQFQREYMDTFDGGLDTSPDPFVRLAARINDINRRRELVIKSLDGKKIADIMPTREMAQILQESLEMRLVPATGSKRVPFSSLPVGSICLGIHHIFPSQAWIYIKRNNDETDNVVTIPPGGRPCAGTNSPGCMVVPLFVMHIGD